MKNTKKSQSVYEIIHVCMLTIDKYMKLCTLQIALKN